MRFSSSLRLAQWINLSPWKQAVRLQFPFVADSAIVLIIFPLRDPQLESRSLLARLAYPINSAESLVVMKNLSNLELF
jgi:hypothetical protein